MAVNGVPPPIDLETGNWSPPSRWMGRVRGWVLLKWILWDPYALRAYAGLYIWAMRSSSLDGGNSQADPRRARLPFLIDVATLIGCVWFVLALFFTLLTMWWLPPDSLFFNALGSATLCAITSVFILWILGWETPHWDVAPIWAFVIGIGAAVLNWAEVGFYGAPLEWGIVLYFSVVIILGALAGVVLNSALHALVRRDIPWPVLVGIRGALIGVYLVGHAIYFFMLRNQILRDVVPFTIPFWYFPLGLLISSLVLWLSCQRIDDWVWLYGGPQDLPSNGRWIVPRVTTKIPPPTGSNLDQWLDDASGYAIVNIAHLWFYTNMRLDIQSRFRRYLNTRGDNESTIQAISSFVNQSFGFGLADLFPEIALSDFSVRPAGYRSLCSRHFWLAVVGESGPYEQEFVAVDCRSERLRAKRSSPRVINVAKGFMLMERWRFEESADVFDGIPNSASAIELAQLARALGRFSRVDDLLAIPIYPRLETPPAVQNRRDVWEAIDHLDKGVCYLWMRERTQRPRSNVELRNSATEQFILARGAELLEPEASLIKVTILLYEGRAGTHQAPPANIMNPPRISNPYCDESIMSKHYVPWERAVPGQGIFLCSSAPPIIVVTGLPGGGVSTFLSNLGIDCVAARVSLNQIADQRNAGESLIRKLMQEIAGQVNQVAFVNFSADDWRQAFLDYVLDVMSSTSKRLVIAIDDYERLEALQLGPVSLGQAIQFVAELSVARSNDLSLILAGHLTPAVMRGIEAHEKIFLPLFNQEQTRQLLEGPIARCTLYYRSDAIERIQALTGGHPTLARLLGAGLVDRYNDSDPRDPVFSAEDVNAVVVPGSVFQNEAEYRVYRPMIELVQRMGASAYDLLSRITQSPNMQTAIELTAFVGTTPNEVGRILADLDRLGLIARGELRNGQETWHITIFLFQEYLRNL